MHAAGPPPPGRSLPGARRCYRSGTALPVLPAPAPSGATPRPPPPPAGSAARPRYRLEPDRRSALPGRCSIPRAAASRPHGAATALPLRSGAAARPELRRGVGGSCAPRGEGEPAERLWGRSAFGEAGGGGWLGRRACFSLPSIERLNELNFRVRYEEGRRILCVDKPCHPLPLRDPHIQCRDDE